MKCGKPLREEEREYCADCARHELAFDQGRSLYPVSYTHLDVYKRQVVAVGTAQELMQCPESITGEYLSGRKKIPVPEVRKKPTGYLKVVGARENNLKNITVEFPLGVMTCVTGVSGSGKSSLVNEILYKKLAKELNRARTIPGKHKRIEGLEQVDKVIDIDQSPIGRTPRSNPATYTGVFDLIRDLFEMCIRDRFKIMGVVFLIMLVGFAVLGVRYFVLVAFLISFLDFLPFFGTGTAMIPWGIYKLSLIHISSAWQRAWDRFCCQEVQRANVLLCRMRRS